MKKVLLVVMLVVVTGILGVFIYFVASISSTYPPIKEYSYAGSIDKFFANIHERVAIDSNMHFKITDTTGLQTTSPAIYFTVSIGKVEYGLKGQTHKTFKGYETGFALVSVFDHDHNIGGYSKDVTNLTPLINKLEATVPSLHFTE